MSRKNKVSGYRDINDVSLNEMFWKDKALCKDEHTSVYFSGPKSKETTTALAICSTCPVRLDCFYEAIQYGYDGVWGGSTYDQRYAIIKHLLNFNIVELTKEKCFIFLRYVDQIGRTKQTAAADLHNIVNK